MRVWNSAKRFKEESFKNINFSKILRLQTRLRRQAKYARQNEFASFRSFYKCSSWSI